MQSKGLIYCLIASWLVSACSETIAPEYASIGWEYYPVKVGSSHIYHVKGVEYISNRDSTNFEYLLKETVIDSFQNLENGISFTLLREKDYGDGLWHQDSVWTIRKEERRVVLSEGNMPKIQLVFPVEENKIWNCNALNANPADEYEMIEIARPYSVPGMDFGNTLTVVQEDQPDVFVAYISRYEIYALHKGLIYKQNVALEYKQGEDYGKQVIESGIKYYQYLLE